MELTGVFEDGEYGFRNGMLPRIWHNEFSRKREKSIGDHAGGQHVYNLYAGTGAGKTCAAGMVASDDLNLNRVRRVVVCVPTVAIAANTREVFREVFGIHLAKFDARSHRNGVTSDWQGYVATYPGIARQAARHRRIASYEPTLVIFDEVHHLGDGESWGDAAQLAFGSVPYVVTMTGSPLRPKNMGRIPFAVYVPTERADVLRYQADYPYTLGRAMIDGYCREPDFRFSDDAVVNVRPAGTDKEFPVRFDEPVSDFLAQLRLTAAVQYGSPTRRRLLECSLAEIRAAGRKCIIFLGGDTANTDAVNTPTGDATILLPSELGALGIGRDEFMVITMADKKPHEKVKQFRQSRTAWILVTVNMVSEGVDIPELSAAIFLTTWVSDLSFIQRIGRALRFMGKGDHPDAWFYLFHHPSYHAIAKEIKREREAEAILRAKRQREQNGEGHGNARERTEAVAVSGGEITYAVWNGERYAAPVYAEALRYVESRGMSKAFLAEVIDHINKGRNDGNAGNLILPA